MVCKKKSKKKKSTYEDRSRATPRRKPQYTGYDNNKHTS